MGTKFHDIYELFNDFSTNVSCKGFFISDVTKCSDADLLLLRCLTAFFFTVTKRIRPHYSNSMRTIV